MTVKSARNFLESLESRSLFSAAPAVVIAPALLLNAPAQIDSTQSGEQTGDTLETADTTGQSASPTLVASLPPSWLAELLAHSDGPPSPLFVSSAGAAASAASVNAWVSCLPPGTSGEESLAVPVMLHGFGGSNGIQDHTNSIPGAEGFEFHQTDFHGYVDGIAGGGSVHIEHRSSGNSPDPDDARFMPGFSHPAIEIDIAIGAEVPFWLATNIVPLPAGSQVNTDAYHTGTGEGEKAGGIATGVKSSPQEETRSIRESDLVATPAGSTGTLSPAIRASADASSGRLHDVQTDTSARLPESAVASGTFVVGSPIVTPALQRANSEIVTREDINAAAAVAGATGRTAVQAVTGSSAAGTAAVRIARTVVLDTPGAVESTGKTVTNTAVVGTATVTAVRTVTAIIETQAASAASLAARLFGPAKVADATDAAGAGELQIDPDTESAPPSFLGLAPWSQSSSMQDQNWLWNLTAGTSLTLAVGGYWYCSAIATHRKELARRLAAARPMVGFVHKTRRDQVQF